MYTGMMKAKVHYPTINCGCLLTTALCAPVISVTYDPQISMYLLPVLLDEMLMRITSFKWIHEETLWIPFLD